jgi:hypothetical protein
VTNLHRNERKQVGGADPPTLLFEHRPGSPVRIVSVREQLESLGAHNAYHFGRIVLLRQLFRAWPPALRRLSLVMASIE